MGKPFEKLDLLLGAIVATRLMEAGLDIPKEDLAIEPELVVLKM